MLGETFQRHGDELRYGDELILMISSYTATERPTCGWRSQYPGTSGCSIWAKTHDQDTSHNVTHPHTRAVIESINPIGRQPEVRYKTKSASRMYSSPLRPVNVESQAFPINLSTFQIENILPNHALLDNNQIPAHSPADSGLSLLLWSHVSR